MIYNKNRVMLDRIVGVFLIILYWMLIISVFALAYQILQYVIAAGKMPVGKSNALPPGFPVDKIIALVIMGVIARTFKTKGQMLLSRAKTFGTYLNILNVDQTFSIERLAASTDIPKVPFIKTPTTDKILFVQDCLVNMINSGYFPKGTHIDPTKKSLIFPGAVAAQAVSAVAAAISKEGSTAIPVVPLNTAPGSPPEEFISFTCKNCGASCRAIKGVESECPYCGTIVRID